MQRPNVVFLKLYVLIIEENISEQCVQAVTLFENLLDDSKSYNGGERDRRVGGNASCSLVDGQQVGNSRSV